MRQPTLHTITITISAALFALMPALAQAQPAAICGSEVPVFTGLGDSFDGRLGEGASTTWLSEEDGSLTLELNITSLDEGANCVFNDGDTVVYYLDTLPGEGFASTEPLTDNADQGRAAASGRGTDGSNAHLEFAPDFGADFAIVVRGDSATLFALVAGGSHEVVRSLTLDPVDFAASCRKEVSGFSMADLGSQAGNPIRWVATLLNATNAFRSNEFQGVAEVPTENIGANLFALAAGDRNILVTTGIPGRLSGDFAWIEFGPFGGAGFSPSPDCDQLDSRAWATTGWSDGSLEFEGTREPPPVNDFSRGISTGGASNAAGGIYAMVVATNDHALGVIPGGMDFTPGSFTLRLRNERDTALVSAAVAYEVWVLNSQGRANSFNFSYSTDGTDFTPVAGLDLVSPEAADDPAEWVRNDRSTTLTDLDVAPGEYLYLRWTGDDVSGGGSRDRFALDDIVVRPTFTTCGNGMVDAGEECDEGADNGTSPCSCQIDCTLPPTGCCEGDEDCSAPGACVSATCNLSTNLCETMSISDCCSVPADCDDGDVCTSGSCTDGECTSTPIADCCRDDSECDDGDACTTNTCAADNTCSFTEIAGCCVEAADCVDDDPCTEGTCEGGSCVQTNICPDDGGTDADAGTPTDGGPPPMIDAGPTPMTDAGLPRLDAGDVGPMGEDGCGCRVGAPSSSPSGWAFLAALGAFALRHRRRA